MYSNYNHDKCINLLYKNLLLIILLISLMEVCKGI